MLIYGRRVKYEIDIKPLIQISHDFPEYYEGYNLKGLAINDEGYGIFGF